MRARILTGERTIVRVGEGLLRGYSGASAVAGSFWSTPGDGEHRNCGDCRRAPDTQPLTGSSRLRADRMTKLNPTSLMGPGGRPLADEEVGISASCGSWRAAIFFQKVPESAGGVPAHSIGDAAMSDLPIPRKSASDQPLWCRAISVSRVRCQCGEKLIGEAPRRR